MMRIIAALAIVVTAAQINAEECRCRSKNVVAFEGDVLCLPTANGWQLARCEKVLNNTAWKFLSQPCTKRTTDSKHYAAPAAALAQTETITNANQATATD